MELSDSIFLKFKRTELEIIRDRGFKIPDNLVPFLLDPLFDTNLNFEQSLNYYGPKGRIEQYKQQLALFKSLFGENLPESMTTEYYNADRTRKILVYYLPRNSDMKKDSFQLQDLQREHDKGLHHIIAITPGQVSKGVMQDVNAAYKVFNISYITYEMMLLHPLRHTLAENFEVLSPELTKSELIDNGFALDKLPIISRDNIISTMFGFPPSTVLEFNRGLIPGQIVSAPFYRIVR